MASFMQALRSPRASQNPMTKRKHLIWGGSMAADRHGIGAVAESSQINPQASGRNRKERKRKAKRDCCGLSKLASPSPVTPSLTRSPVLILKRRTKHSNTQACGTILTPSQRLFMEFGFNLRE